MDLLIQALRRKFIDRKDFQPQRPPSATSPIPGKIGQKAATHSRVEVLTFSQSSKIAHRNRMRRNSDEEKGEEAHRGIREHFQKTYEFPIPISSQQWLAGQHAPAEHVYFSAAQPNIE
jgi:hypothetical protein